MAKSKITKVTGNGSWQGNYGTMYSFEYQFEDGTVGIADHKTSSAKYNIDEIVDYNIKKQDKMGNNKINFPSPNSNGYTPNINGQKMQTNYNGYPKKDNDIKEKNRSFALSYAKDLAVADKISVDNILKKADEYNNWLNT